MYIKDVRNKGDQMFIEMQIVETKFKAASKKRAQKAINIMLGLVTKNTIGDRAFDNCFEMGDGDAVNEIVMKTLIANDVRFLQLPLRTQWYFGEECFNKRMNEFKEAV